MSLVFPSVTFPAVYQRNTAFDILNGAVAILFLNKMVGTYSGYSSRWRRSSDSEEQDIGFVDGGFDWDSLLTFKGAGSVFLKTLYDQSGNGNHATQTNTSKQPVLITQTLDDGTTVPAAYFDGSNDFMSLTNMGCARKIAGLTTIMVCRPPSNSSLGYFYQVSAGGANSLVARQTLQMNANNTIQGFARSLDTDSAANTPGSSASGNVNGLDVYWHETDFTNPLTEVFFNNVSIGDSDDTGTSGNMTAGQSDDTDSLAITIGGRGTSGSNCRILRFRGMAICPRIFTSVERTFLYNSIQANEGATEL